MQIRPHDQCLVTRLLLLAVQPVEQLWRQKSVAVTSVFTAICADIRGGSDKEMGDAGRNGRSGSRCYDLTSGIQTVTGAKTYNDQKLIFRNPADTFSLTQRNPVITADGIHYVNPACTLIINGD